MINSAYLRYFFLSDYISPQLQGGAGVAGLGCWVDLDMKYVIPFPFLLGQLSVRQIGL